MWTRGLALAGALLLITNVGAGAQPRRAAEVLNVARFLAAWLGPKDSERERARKLYARATLLNHSATRG